MQIYYDPDWLMLVKEAQAFLSPSLQAPLPAALPISQDTREFVERLAARATSPQGCAVPSNFVPTAPFYYGTTNDGYDGSVPIRRGNNQTDAYLAMLDLPHVITVPYEPEATGTSEEDGGADRQDPNALDIDDLFLVCCRNHAESRRNNDRNTQNMDNDDEKSIRRNAPNNIEHSFFAFTFEQTPVNIKNNHITIKTQ